MTLTIILGVTAFLASIWGVWQAIKSVSEGSNFDENWDKTCPCNNIQNGSIIIGDGKGNCVVCGTKWCNEYEPKPLQWFLDRIGKRVYRDVLECDCESCREIEKDGLIIRDELHASYLYAIDQDFWTEGVKCNYRDEK